jgi:tRNA (cmo5U34)-methyltransferase
MSAHTSHNFNSIAPVYDRLAAWVFGQSVKKAQLDTIPWISPGTTVLIMGGGTGWYLKELLAQKKLKKVVYIEASRKMLDLTGKKIAGILPRLTDTVVELRLGTEENIYAGEQFDIVVTHFFLDIFEPVRLKKIMCALNQVLSPQGLWLIADFRLPEQAAGPAYWWKKLLVNAMLLFFRIVSCITARELPGFPEIFAAFNRQAVYEKSFYSKLIVTSVYAGKK